MLSGMPKSFTCRSVGSRTRGIWVVTMYVGEVPGYIAVGECISCPTVEVQEADGDSPVRPL